MQDNESIFLVVIKIPGATSCTWDPFKNCGWVGYKVILDMALLKVATEVKYCLHLWTEAL